MLCAAAATAGAAAAAAAAAVNTTPIHTHPPKLTLERGPDSWHLSAG